MAPELAARSTDCVIVGFRNVLTHGYAAVDGDAVDGVATEDLATLRRECAIERLAEADPVLAGVVARWGPPPFWRHSEGFAGLVHGILAQQVSLASAVAAGALDRDRLEAASDDEVRRELLALRGIGRWTADVDLLFALRRPDGWPSGDLALAKAVEALWGLPALLGWDELDTWAERWRPQRAVAARFLWHDDLSRRGPGWSGGTSAG